MPIKILLIMYLISSIGLGIFLTGRNSFNAITAFITSFLMNAAGYMLLVITFVAVMILTGKV